MVGVEQVPAEVHRRVRVPRRYGVTACRVRVVAGRGLAHNIRGLPSRGCLLGLSDTCGRPRCLPSVRSVGLDVHARSVAAAAIDGVTGELFQTRLTPAHDDILDLLRSLPGPVAVAYEAGPTGFWLYRAG